MTSTKRGFTLIELLVVVAMIAILLASLTTSVSSAQERARIQKAMGDVKVMSQAILAYENYSRGGRYKLEPMTKENANKGSLGFLLGAGQSADSGGKIPALLMAELRAGGDIRDPWGTPYKVTIKSGDATVSIQSASGSMQTGYYLPNFYRLSAKERQ
jgi:prepilin-type N-terminal cleavage/methylation domain-containing protein